MELSKVGKNTYYIKNNTNIGIYLLNDKDVILIDSGNDKDAGKKILKIVTEQGWNIKAIINTHSNADHIGGNKVIQDRLGIDIYCSKLENVFIENPILESSFLYGGFSFDALRNKFLCASSSSAKDISNINLEGLEIISLKGHYFDMIGIKTKDNVYFLGDSLFSIDTISKYHIFYIYDVKEFLNTLDYLETLEGNFYIPSHTEGTDNIKELINLNRNKVNEIIEKLINICEEGKTFEEILKTIFDDYNLKLDANQYVLVGNAIKSYLSYLSNEKKITYEFIDNRMMWKKI